MSQRGNRGRGRTGTVQHGSQESIKAFEFHELGQRRGWFGHAMSNPRNPDFNHSTHDYPASQRSFEEGFTPGLMNRGPRLRGRGSRKDRRGHSVEQNNSLGFNSNSVNSQTSPPSYGGAFGPMGHQDHLHGQEWMKYCGGPEEYNPIQLTHCSTPPPSYEEAVNPMAHHETLQNESEAFLNNQLCFNVVPSAPPLEGWPPNQGPSGFINAPQVATNCVDVSVLVKHLTEFTDYSTSVETLSKIVCTSYNEIYSAIKQNSSIFETVVDQPSQKLLVKLRPKIKICYHHLGSDKGCKDPKCLYVHICSNYVLGSCSTKNCPYGHTYNNDHNSFMLSNLHLEKISHKALHKLMQKRLEGLKKSKLCPNRIFSNLNSESSNSEDTSYKLSMNKGASKSANKSESNTVFAFQFHGNVEVAAICHLGINDRCPHIAIGCKYLHAKQAYHWQFGKEGKWFNFYAYHSQILMNHYSDVKCEDAVLPTLNLTKVNKSNKDLISLLGDKSIKVDFNSMTIDCESSKATFAIRLLVTCPLNASNSEHITHFNWYFKDDAGEWQLFGKSASSSRSLENAYLANSTGTTQFQSPKNKFKYVVDFSKMTQKNLSTNKIRPMRRRPDASQFKQTSGKASFVFPKHWDIMHPGDECRTIKLSNFSDEFKNLRQIVQLTLPMNTVNSISRIQNVLLWKQFLNMQMELERVYSDRPLNIQKLFHGINPKHLDEICKDNFEGSLHDSKISMKYGRGTYFYSSAGVGASRCVPDFMGNKTLLVAEVIIGKVTEGYPHLTKPPINNSLLNKHFDTTTDNMSNPSVFVKYNKQEYYPAYLVEFC